MDNLQCNLNVMNRPLSQTLESNYIR